MGFVYNNKNEEKEEILRKRLIDTYNNWANQYLNKNEIVVYQNCEDDPTIINVFNQITIYTWDENN